MRFERVKISAAKGSFLLSFAFILRKDGIAPFIKQRQGKWKECIQSTSREGNETSWQKFVMRMKRQKRKGSVKLSFRNYIRFCTALNTS
ncbi:hypothetical protein B4168_1568 [Anoxybacillus flavithermus]|nr:hypothetical protein B4168_1568 [Anoxybacillus flavithermus]OAO84222.1 hypothetical protein GT23_3757 [Parageobacillus thermoglucosidasius]